MTTPNLLTIITQAGPVECTAAELLDLDASFSRHPDQSLFPLPNHLATNPNDLSHFDDPAEVTDNNRNIHKPDNTPLVNYLLTIADGILLTENQLMVNEKETEWLAAQIRTAIAESGITQTAIAEHCGVSKAAVTMWLKRGTIKKSALPLLAMATGKPLSFFIFGANESPKTSDPATKLIDEIKRLDTLGLLNETAIQGMLAHARSYDPATKAAPEVDQPTPEAAPRPASTGESESAEDFLKAQMLTKEPIKKQV